MKPPGIDCPYYLAEEGSKKCRSYIGNGACKRRDHLMCVEWVKLNEPHGGLARKLIAPPEGMAEEDQSAEPVPPKEQVESLKATGATVRLTTPGGKLHIVPEYTGKDRNELSMDHAVAVLGFLRAFPGTKIVEFERDENA